MNRLFGEGETPNFTGKAVVSLAGDPQIMSKTGRILLTINLAYEYGFSEDDGSYPGDILSMKWRLRLQGRTWLAAITPSFVRIPMILLHYASYKF